jgi:glutamate dehydrogenase
MDQDSSWGADPNRAAERAKRSLGPESAGLRQQLLTLFPLPLQPTQLDCVLAAIGLLPVSKTPIVLHTPDAVLVVAAQEHPFSQLIDTLTPFLGGTVDRAELILESDFPGCQILRWRKLEISQGQLLDSRFAAALEGFLHVHPLEPADERFAILVQGVSAAILDLLSVPQQIDLLELSLQAQQSDALHLRIESSSSDGSWLFYGAAQELPPTGWIEKLGQIVQRCGWTWQNYAQSARAPDRGLEVFAWRVQPHASENQPSREELLAAVARELRFATVFRTADRVESVFVKSERLRADLAAIVRAMVRFAHQGLLYADAFEFNLANCEDAFCAHPEITECLCQAFESRFHPVNHSDAAYREALQHALRLVEQLHTGHEGTDRRRKMVLGQGISFVEHILKTTFYADTASLAFRLDPSYLERLPSAALEKFPEIPFGVFLLFQNQSMGFHIRFRDLARGGLRTVMPQHIEQLVIERNQIFQEGYHLAFTQQKKNKDIPEGGAKGILLLSPFEEMNSANGHATASVTELNQQLRLQQLYRSQRQYIEGLLALVNCDSSGTLRDRRIRDLYGKPEYLYVGPDENMHNSMLIWIAETAQRVGYRPGKAFISSKPEIGINHKEYGVTSLGVHVYVEQVLRYLGIEAARDPFSVKMAGGPDGDVAGNEMLNLLRRCATTCKLLSTIDGSGTIRDDQGLHLATLAELFHRAEPIRDYPMDQLSEGAFFIDSRALKEQAQGSPLMLRKSKQGGKVVEEWIPQSEAFALLRSTMFQTPADLFIPAGGRPRTLNESNIQEFCLAGGEPSVRAIVEGANLFLTPKARRYLEEKGVLIVKDSSANKGGVICSSFEVLLGLTLSDEEFLALKPQFMPEVLGLIEQKALAEAQLLLRAHEETGRFLTDLSDEISARINLYKDQLLSYFSQTTLDLQPLSPYGRIILDYCPATLRQQYPERVFQRLPESHLKAILACQIASQTVYQKGVDWAPSIVEVLPLLTQDWGHGRTE